LDVVYHPVHAGGVLAASGLGGFCGHVSNLPTEPLM
jgi:hypothetical protein